MWLRLRQGPLRALLDSAAFANMQGGFVSNDAKIAPGDNHITPGVYAEVNMSAEELARAFYTPPIQRAITGTCQVIRGVD